MGRFSRQSSSFPLFDAATIFRILGAYSNPASAPENRSIELI